ncbi:CHAD domain-containing protein [Belnapia sp. T6]|uniref:CHAD domain-containing protein n=1 Tax=Belnapia mucosa TaxID=2804532 RepID=A0ABS1V077_9PROT|nr:CHAD domain-containing protein [Belnapia mucosa]MBL6455113.1 CHAD domain-containing protein [Belnapia mucosa]
MAPAGSRGRTAGPLPRPARPPSRGDLSLTRFDATDAAAEPPAEPAPPADAAAQLSLEFALDPEAVQRLPRHPAITSARAGRARSLAEELIWMDSAEGVLAADGLALEVPRRGPRRLIRSMPPAEAPWCPGTPPALEEMEPTDENWVPIAAFSGRRSVMALGEVTAELLAGKLRAVAAEAPVARLLLTGPTEAVLARAAALAADIHMLPPAASLAEEGRALARGGPPRPRRRGPPPLSGAATVEAALLAALGHLLEVMLVHAPACRLGAGMEGVHQTRVALRRLRSVLKVFRPVASGPELVEFDDGLRAMAAALGPARDWDVFLAGTAAEAAAAIGGDRRLAALLRAGEARRQEAYAALRRLLDGPAFPRLVLAGIGLIQRRPWREGPPESLAPLEEPLPDFAAGVLDKRWHRLRKRGEDIAEHGAAALHEVRLDAKRLRYAAELFAPLWPGKPARRFLRRLSALQEELGLANDVAVARELAASLGTGVPGWAIGAVEGFASARASRARRHALESWDELLEAEPFWR